MLPRIHLNWTQPPKLCKKTTNQVTNLVKPNYRFFQVETGRLIFNLRKMLTDHVSLAGFADGPAKSSVLSSDL